MKFRTRITLQFSVVVSVILISFSFVIYSLLSDFRKDEFTERLRDKGLSSVKLLADVDEVSPELLKIIDRSAANPLPGEEVFIYDIHKHLVYCNLAKDEDKISKPILNRIMREKEILFAEDSTETFGFLFQGHYDQYFVVTSGHDKFGLSKLNYLRNILISGDILSVGLIFIIGLLFSKEALHPLSKVVHEIDQITVSNLGVRLEESQTKDEIGLLTVRFNRMLARLDEAFEAQRSFVANASHELRTPLTSLTGQLEVLLMNKHMSAESREILSSLLHEIRQLNKLSNGLLDLAQANLDVTEINMQNIRMDELLGLARADLLKRNKDFNISIEFNGLPEENWLTLYGNEQLLRSALSNLIENACKYSEDRKAEVMIDFDDHFIRIQIVDHGSGISETDLQHVFEPFYRASTVKHLNGHGIGLTLTKKIIEIHGGQISLKSQINQGSTVYLLFPHQS